MATRGPRVRPERFPDVFDRLAANVAAVVQGKDEAIRLALVCLFAEGHLLINDVPGVGKTLLAKSLARSLGCTWRRIQFTPDLLPSDVTGVNVFNQQQREFEFRPGAVFANVVLADEINRASPKTQSSLLEVMEERQITVDGVTHVLSPPFIVIATQNPIEYEGTYPLPFAQLDRFLMRISLGYPDREAETLILDTHSAAPVLDGLTPACDATTALAMVEAARGIHAADGIRRYIVELVDATRRAAGLALGASPRAAIALLRTARALAAASGRDYVLPDDVKRLAGVVLTHRLMLSAEAEMAGQTADEVLRGVLDRVPLPVG